MLFAASLFLLTPPQYRYTHTHHTHIAAGIAWSMRQPGTGVKITETGNWLWKLPFAPHHYKPFDTILSHLIVPVVNCYCFVLSRRSWKPRKTSKNWFPPLPPPHTPHTHHTDAPPSTLIPGACEASFLFSLRFPQARSASMYIYYY